jgi:hypothetical protein
MSTFTHQSAKERLRQLVELIDDEADMAEALEYLAWLASDQLEELSEGEWERVRKGQEQIAAGQSAPWEDVKRELDL